MRFPQSLILAAACAVIAPVSADAASRPKSKAERAPAPEAVAEAPPVLVTTEGRSGGWSTIPELIAAAEKDDPLASFQYAQLLETGDQVPRDHPRALEFYRRSGEAGNGDALFRLGKVYHDGLLGLAVDFRTATEYYRRAAAAGVPEAMYNLGAMLVSARGVQRDYVAGLAWLMVAAQHGAGGESGVEQVRQRLARRPDQIAAAEQRAQVLAEQLQKGDVPALNGIPSVPAARATPPLPTLLPPPRSPVEVERATERPGIGPPSITIEKPVLDLPAPPPRPVAPPPAPQE
jgi:uncharacterized protein